MTIYSHKFADDDASRAFCLTVKEIMAIYRVSRCTAYAQAALYLRRGPGHGIPCLKVGNSLRFPAAWIEAHIGRPVEPPAHIADRSVPTVRQNGPADLRY